MPPCIVVSGVSKVYEGRVRALEGVSTIVEEGEVRAFLGPNGAGKTTLMRILTTQLRPTEGDAWVKGFHVVRDSSRVRELIGYVPQEFSVWSDLTGYENMLIYAKLYGVPRDRRSRLIEEALEFMGLEEAAGRLVKTYSGGMIRRLELAIALMTRPEVLLLDEPTIGLDPRARALVWERLLEYKRDYGTTIVFNTHYMDEAERYAERVTVLNRGRVVAEGSPRELVKQVGGGDVNRVRVNGDLGAALRALSGLAGVEVAAQGNPLVLRVENADTALALVSRRLAEAGVDVREISVGRPTLEDVFIKVTGMSFEEAERAGYREAARARRAIARGG